MDVTLGAAILGGIQGQGSRLVKNYFDMKKHKIEMKYKSVGEVRQITNPRFMTMQGIIAFMIVFYVCVAPFVVSFTQIPIDIAYIESNGWLKALFSGSENILWYHMQGLPVSPVHTYLASSTVFYFFGNTGR